MGINMKLVITVEVDDDVEIMNEASLRENLTDEIKEIFWSNSNLKVKEITDKVKVEITSK